MVSGQSAQLFTLEGGSQKRDALSIYTEVCIGDTVTFIGISSSKLVYIDRSIACYKRIARMRTCRL